MLKKDIDSEQLCYYQTGIGTYVNPGIFTPILTFMAKTMDKAIAWCACVVEFATRYLNVYHHRYLNEHVEGGYRFLMQNYCDGDRICLFG
jgi:uncharacterized protein (DUF2235 family)